MVWLVGVLGAVAAQGVGVADDRVRPSGDPAMPPQTISLLPPRCPAARTPDEAVVCAQDKDRYRLKRLPEPAVEPSAIGKPFDRQIAPGVHIHGLGLRITF